MYPSISPDGTKVAFNRVQDGVADAWVAPVSNLESAVRVTNTGPRGLSGPVRWAPDSKHLLLMKDVSGDGRYSWHSVALSTGKSIQLTPPMGGPPAQIVPTGAMPPVSTDVVLIAMPSDKSKRVVYAVNIETGNRSIVEEGIEGVFYFIADESLTVRAAVRHEPDGSESLHWLSPDGWKQVIKWREEDSIHVGQSRVIGLQDQGKSLLMTSSSGQDKPALIKIHLQNGKVDVIASGHTDSVIDVGGRPLLSPKNGRLQVYGETYLVRRHVVLDQEVSPDIAFLRQELGPEFEVTSRSLSGQVWIVQSNDPTKGISSYLYSRPDKQLTRLFDYWPELADVDLRPMHARLIRARDGLMLTAYLTLPPGSDSDEDGTPDAPMPMVLNVHGGPTERDQYGFRLDHQYFASRGYAVLSVNFRGSTGFGKAFLRAGFGEVGRKMQNDLIDAVDWAISKNIAVPDKVAIYGISYGGYATLAGLAFTPDKFACGVDLVGPSDAALNLTDPNAKASPALYELLKKFFGADPSSETGLQRLREISPLAHAGRINKPLLIMHGANDPAVSRAHSDRVVAAMQSAGQPVTYIVFPDEGHGFNRPANAATSTAVIEHFLARCLGGHAEPFGWDMAGTSARIEADAGYIPGLAKALEKFSNASSSSGKQATNTSSPVPLELIASGLNKHGYQGVDLSPDGHWIARTIEIPGDKLVADTNWFTATGASTAFGLARQRVSLTNIRTGESILLGGGSATAWGGAWSPDGQHLAYYSDQDGEFGIWIWEAETQTSWRFPDVIARAWHVTHPIRWLDSSRFITKVLPKGVTIAQANGLAPKISLGESFQRFPPTEEGAVSVAVLKPRANEASSDAMNSVSDSQSWAIGDLAMLNLITKKPHRLATQELVNSYEVSPDGGQAVYTVFKRFDPVTYRSFYDINLVNFATDRKRLVASDVSMSSMMAWSPDSTRIAFLTLDQSGRNRAEVIAVESGERAELNDEEVPSLNTKQGLGRVLWGARGSSLFAVSEGKIWSIPINPSETARAYQIEGKRILDIIGRPEVGSANLFGRTEDVLVGVTSQDMGYGISRIDLVSGASESILWSHKNQILFGRNADVSADGRSAVYTAQGQQSLPEVWLLEPDSGKSEQVTTLDAGLVNYNLGRAETLEWTDAAGTSHSATLLLPPGYRSGQRLPLVVWAYGGRMGSRDRDTFGLVGTAAFNMQILATRGYAVLDPDIPIEIGRPAEDVFIAVMRSVDAAVAKGFADPDRLAIMGTSFGSFSTLAVITRTNRFKAAIISAVLHPDLLAGYLLMKPDGEAADMAFYESGQGRIGGSPWEHQELYISNSPIYDFDKIETPLLMAHGTADFLPLSGPNSVFVALQRLGKPVEYLIYEDEGHVIQKKANIIDFWKRRITFLAHHLGKND